MSNSFKKVVKYPSIEQFRTVVSNVNRHFNFVGLDENGEAIYDPTKPKPTLVFKGTVKLHGTNSAISYNKENGIWAQSSENIITPQSDNAGFAFFVESNKKVFNELIYSVQKENNIDLDNNTISIYGEWVGRGIQKNVGISELDKSMFIFGVKITPHVETEEGLTANPAYWVDHTYLKSPENKIYNINDFKTYEIEIDFNHPQLSQNKIIDMTIEVENECPVSKDFGVYGIGEGIVFSCDYNGVRHIFKSKGEKHAGKSKPKVLHKVDDEKLKKIVETAEKVTPTWRLAQMLEQSCDLMNGGELDRRKLGDYIRLVMSDIMKEEIDTISEAKLEPKDINKYVSEISKRYFFEQEKV
jgi:hypothetical protein